jgi:hypothetical protein
VAHGKSARKVEKRRLELVNAILQGKALAKNVGAFKGDTSLSATAYRCFSIYYIVIKEDYAKIVDMEEIAEQSYDAMEAYLAAQDIASEKLDEAYKQFETEYKAFAGRHNIQLIEEDTKLSKMAETASKVMDYYHQVYLIFFKSYKQEAYLVAALDKKDINGIEQNKNALLKCSEEGLSKISKLASFEGDADLAAACRTALQFYQNEARNKIAPALDYYMKVENFDKIKKAMETKSSSQRTNADINAYNAAVNDMNSSTAGFNKTMKETYEARNKSLNGWNSASENFLSRHTPRYNK